MDVTYDSSGTAQQIAWAQHALTRSNYPYPDDLKVTVTWTDATACGANHTYMCTSDQGYDPVAPAQLCLVQIETWADDATDPQNAGIPAGQLQHFYEASFLHEMGHCAMIHALRWGVQVEDIARLFIHARDGRTGTLADWAPTDRPWEEHIVEGAAEMIKLASYMDFPVFGQRTHWSLPQSNWDAFVRLVAYRFTHTHSAMNPRLFSYPLAPPKPDYTTFVDTGTEDQGLQTPVIANVYWDAAPLPSIDVEQVDVGLAAAWLATYGTSPPYFDGIAEPTDVPIPPPNEPPPFGQYPINLYAYRHVVSAVLGIWHLSDLIDLTTYLHDHDPTAVSGGRFAELRSDGVALMPFGQAEIDAEYGGSVPGFLTASDGGLGLLHVHWDIDTSKALAVLMEGSFDWVGDATDLGGVWNARARLPRDERTRPFNWQINSPTDLSDGGMLGYWDQFWQEGNELPPGVTTSANLNGGDSLPPVPIVPVPSGDDLVIGWVVQECASAWHRTQIDLYDSITGLTTERYWPTQLDGHVARPGVLAPGWGTFSRRVRSPVALPYPTFHAGGTVSTVVPGEPATGPLTTQRRLVGSVEASPVVLNVGAAAPITSSPGSLSVGEQDSGTVRP